MNKEQACWKARIYHDKAVTEQIEVDLRVMVAAIIGEQRLDIDESTEGFDQYPSCKNWEKKYCHCRPVKFQGYLRPHGYVFYGNSRIEIYCKIIAAIAGNKLYFPYSVLPRCTDENKEDEQ